MRPLLYIRRRYWYSFGLYGALLGNHLTIEMEDSPVDYNEETGKQAYENVAGEVYGGNYTVSRRRHHHHHQAPLAPRHHQ